VKKRGIAIVNASPLIFLSRGGHLELLRVFAETARVPKPVADNVPHRSAYQCAELWGSCFSPNGAGLFRRLVPYSRI